MPILYFILAIILLITWLGPYILIGVVVLLVSRFLYMLIKEQGSIYDAGGEHSSTKKQVREKKKLHITIIRDVKKQPITGASSEDT